MKQEKKSRLNGDNFHKKLRINEKSFPKEKKIIFLAYMREYALEQWWSTFFAIFKLLLKNYLTLFHLLTQDIVLSQCWSTLVLLGSNFVLTR